MTNRERRLLIWTLVSFAAFGTWLWFYNRPHMEFFCQEDGFVEYSEAFLYLFAAALFLYVGAHQQFRTVWHFGYALLFFGVFAEEVSWGQRIFNIATPARMNAINVQSEISIHNIDGLHQHHHLYGVLVCSVICLWLPLAVRYAPAVRRLCARLVMPVFPLWTWPLPVIAFAFMIVPRLYGQKLFVFDEMGELYLAFAFFGFAVSTYVEARPSLDPELVASATDATEGIASPAPVSLRPS